jgi:predicted aspartyl protease
MVPLKTQTNNLTAEQRAELPAEFLANERDYLALRERLLQTHRGQWVAVRDGQIVAADHQFLPLMRQVEALGGHPYVARVGAEEETVFKVRRAEFPYDRSYQPFALPRLAATFWDQAGKRCQTFGDVVPDTGADTTVLPGTDCRAFGLFASQHFTAMAGSVLGAAVPAVIYHAQVEVAGSRYRAFVQPVPGGQDRLLGRDVLNQLRVLFDGPGDKVVVDP